MSTRLDRVFGSDAAHPLCFLALYGPADVDPLLLPGGWDQAANWPRTIAGLSSVRVHRGRDTARDTFTPGTFAATVVGELADDQTGAVDLEIGRRVRLQLDKAALDRVFGAGTYPAASRILYTGVVTDFGPSDVGAGQSVKVTPVQGAALGSQNLARAQEATVAGGLDPQPGMDLAIIGGCHDPLGVDPGVTFPQRAIAGLSEDTVTSVTSPRPTLPLADAFAHWDVTGQTMQSILDDLMASTSGTWIERRSGLADWLTAEGRRVYTSAPSSGAGVLVLDASVILSGLSTSRTPADLGNHVTVSYGDGSLSVLVTDPDSIYKHGRREVPLTTRLATADAATRHGQDYVGRYAWPAWTVPAITLDLLWLIESGRAALAAQVLDLEIARVVELAGLPTNSQVPNGAYWVEGIDLEISAGRFLVTLALVSYALLAPNVQWQDHPVSGLSWADVPEWVTWLRATTWLAAGGTVTPRYAWKLAPAGLHWSAVDAGLTWATWV